MRDMADRFKQEDRCFEGACGPGKRGKKVKREVGVKKKVGIPRKRGPARQTSYLVRGKQGQKRKEGVGGLKTSRYFQGGCGRKKKLQEDVNSAGRGRSLKKKKEKENVFPPPSQAQYIWIEPKSRR